MYLTKSQVMLLLLPYNTCLKWYYFSVKGFLVDFCEEARRLDTAEVTALRISVPRLLTQRPASQSSQPSFWAKKTTSNEERGRREKAPYGIKNSTQNTGILQGLSQSALESKMNNEKSIRRAGCESVLCLTDRSVSCINQWRCRKSLFIMPH